MSRLASIIWARIHKPRVISATYALMYLIFFYAGISALLDPPQSVEGLIGQVAMTILATLLTVGGAIGAPSALFGTWWLERVALGAVTFSAGIYAAIVLAIELSSPTGNRQLQLGFILAVLLLQIPRWHRIRRRPYDPGLHQ